MAITAATSAAATPSSGVNLQDFLKILTSQLSNQDPLKPLDNQEFVAQIAQFTTLEQSRQLNLKIDQLLTVQSSVQSIGLLGKSVDINAESGTVSGQVTALNFVSGVPELTIKTASGSILSGLSMAQLIAVR